MHEDVMSFADVRRLLFQFHMWIGLILGLLLALLGLSGSVLVYDDAIAGFLAPVPQAGAKGEARPLDKIVEAARGAAGRGAMQISLPREPGEAISVRITQSRGGEGAGRGEGRARRNSGAGAPPVAEGPRAPATQIFIDPV